MPERKKRKYLRVALVFMLILGLMLAMATTAFAKGSGNINQNINISIKDDNAIGVVLSLIKDFAGWGNEWNKTIGMCRRIGLCLCAVCVAVGAFMMIVSPIMGGDSPEKSIEKGKAVIKIAIVAFFCLLLLPAVIRTANLLVHSGDGKLVWTPPKGVAP